MSGEDPAFTVDKACVPIQGNKQATACDPVQSYDHIANSHDQHVYDHTESFSQSKPYEQICNPYDQPQGYESIRAYESLRRCSVDGDGGYA